MINKTPQTKHQFDSQINLLLRDFVHNLNAGDPNTAQFIARQVTSLVEHVHETRREFLCGKNSQEYIRWILQNVKS